jgi:hypothetical protein
MQCSGNSLIQQPIYQTFSVHFFFGTATVTLFCIALIVTSFSSERVNVTAMLPVHTTESHYHTLATTEAAPLHDAITQAEHSSLSSITLPNDLATLKHIITQAIHMPHIITT